MDNKAINPFVAYSAATDVDGECLACGSRDCDCPREPRPQSYDLRQLLRHDAALARQIAEYEVPDLEKVSLAIRLVEAAMDEINSVAQCTAIKSFGSSAGYADENASFQDALSFAMDLVASGVEAVAIGRYNDGMSAVVFSDR